MHSPKAKEVADIVSKV